MLLGPGTVVVRVHSSEREAGADLALLEEKGWAQERGTLTV